ncbi:lysylphosphatidylglycerol synthase transmembrane domain-containing protein [Blastococcus jejuensis]|uniref:Lysylphosphatidylglycerol synthase transmembrane domain-containing protein n=1 Tax=Blastococcus jejuensis TaxID=351224 RepID=A0ABP6NNG9_9ACTN
MSAPADGAGRTRVRGWRWVVRTAFLVAALVACGLVIWRTREDFLAAVADVSAFPLVLAFLAVLVGGVVPMFAWRVLILDLGSPIPLAAGARIYFVAQLGKFIPGSVWSVLAQVELAREYRVPARRSATVGLLTIVTAAVSAVLVLGLALPFSTEELRRGYWWVVLLLPPLLVLLYPPVIRRWSALLFRLLRRPADDLDVSVRALAASVGWMVVAWVFYGLQLYALVADAAPDDVSAGPQVALQCLGIFALAWVAGLLFVVVPAGAGVREVIIVLGLASVLPSGAALAVALLSRVLLTVTDLLLAGLAVLAYRARRSRDAV